jgi:hypothetical protein
VLGSCAPLSHKVISIDGTSTENLATVSMLSVDLKHPLLLVGLDGELLQAVRFQSAFRTWSFVVSPGEHILWVSNVPYGLPLIPQRRRCYAMDVFLEPGSHYILREDPTDELVLLLPQGGSKPVASGRLVDNPLIFERDCRWK